MINPCPHCGNTVKKNLVGIRYDDGKKTMMGRFLCDCDNASYFARPFCGNDSQYRQITREQYEGKVAE